MDLSSIQLPAPLSNQERANIERQIRTEEKQLAEATAEKKPVVDQNPPQEFKRIENKYIQQSPKVSKPQDVRSSAYVSHRTTQPIRKSVGDLYTQKFTISRHETDRQYSETARLRKKVIMVEI